MLPNLIFQLCGLQSFASHSSSFVSSLALLWCTANVLLYVAALAFCFIERRWLFTDRHNRGINFIPFIKSAITIVAHLVVLVEALLARNAYRAFDERLGRVDGTLGKLTGSAGVILRQAGRRFRIKLLLFVTFCCATELAILGMVYPDRVEQAIWCLTVPSLIVTRMKHLHHAHHIDRLTARFTILREQLETLCSGGTPEGKWLPGGSTRNRRNAFEVLHRPVKPGPVPMTAWLKGSSQPSRHDPGDSYQPDHLRRVFLVKGTYLALWHAAKDLNGCCVYSQLTNLLQNFIQCTCDLYSLYSLLYLNQFEHIFAFILSVVATFAGLGIVLAACENCKNQMAAAITTYMVIFIQFMPKDESGVVDSGAANASTSGPPISTAAMSSSTL
uniref:Gustatory receptor n=1 Tax=Anopheles atroparvus TaxID=41427 RepID=A0A182IS54_ANOAO